MNKTALVISAVFTTLIVLSIGGIIYSVQANTTGPQNPSQAAEQAIPADREAAYQARLEEANARLLAARSTQEAAEIQSATMQAILQDPGFSDWMFGNDPDASAASPYDDHSYDHEDNKEKHKYDDEDHDRDHDDADEHEYKHDED